MIIKNKLTGKVLELSLEEFKIRFKNELKIAIESYLHTEQLKPYYRTQRTESDFYFDLRWNFNNYNNSAWYIERFIK